MKPHEQILMHLPEQFSRRDFIQMVASETAYSYSHAQNLLDAAIHERSIERIGRGEYKKCEPEVEIERPKPQKL